MNSFRQLHSPRMRILRITLLAGLILLCLFGAALTVFYLIEENILRPESAQDSFYRILREYDIAVSEIFGAVDASRTDGTASFRSPSDVTEREYDYLNMQLDRLERNAVTVESWLSILKRRRALSLIHRPSIANYNKSINSALTAYPVSQPIAALAAAALVKDSAINRENEQKIRQWLPLLSSPIFNNIRLGLHVLLGDFKDPKTADLYLSDVVSDGTELITVNLAVLKTMRRNFQGAMSDIQMMLNAPLNVPLPSFDTLRFAAEYHYDFGELLRSAEIFSIINDEAANIRQADALYLAGFEENAISIWKLLENETGLYNLAVTSQEQNELIEAAAFLEKLNSIGTVSNINSRQFGLIRYSRLQELPRAAEVLQTNAFFAPANFPYIDLEICKRQTQEWNLGRRIAETWLLLDRHSENEDLYKWAAWHFFFQRRFDETPVFFERLSLLQFTEHWVNVYRAIQLMLEGRIDMAENILLSIPLNETDWSVHANLGRIYEEQRSPSRALFQYELAVSKTSNNRTAARLQQQIARCFIALGRQNEAIRVLLYALDLDPQNMSARLELNRLLY